jgi:hypothetical protein
LGLVADKDTQMMELLRPSPEEAFVIQNQQVGFAIVIYYFICLLLKWVIACLDFIVQCLSLCIFTLSIKTCECNPKV